MTDAAQLASIELQLELLYIQTRRLNRMKRKLQARIDRRETIQKHLAKFEPAYRQAALQQFKAQNL